MSPEAASTLAKLSRLRTSVVADLETLEHHASVCSRLLTAWPQLGGDPAQRAYAATELHAWYTCLETLNERIARNLDGSVPSGGDWHRELLRQAMTELRGLRPAILPASVERPLHALLSFRHFFRNAYAVDLDAGKLEENLKQLALCAQPTHAAVSSFRDFLSASELAVVQSE